MSGSDKILFPEMTKLIFLFRRCLVPFTHWLGYFIIALLQRKKTKKRLVNASKKSVKVSFVTSGIEKMKKRVEDFLFLPLCIVYALSSSVVQYVTDSRVVRSHYLLVSVL